MRFDYATHGPKDFSLSSIGIHKKRSNGQKYSNWQTQLTKVRVGDEG